MPKLKKWTVVTALLLLSLSAEAGAQAQPRDLRKPSTRLVGHWVTDGHTHYYFGPVDSTDIGSLTWVEDNGNGRVVKHRYKVIGEVPRGTELTIQILFGAGGMRVDQYVVSEDGLSMRSTLDIDGIKIVSTHRYVDARTRPDP